MKTVIITAADNMSDATYKLICEGFKKKLGYEAEYKRITDNSIIGGFVADVDGEIYD